MVGDPDVLISSSLTCLRDLVDGVAAVGCAGVTVEEPAQLGTLDQSWYRAPDLVAGFAQLWRDPGESKCSVQGDFGRRWHKATPLPERSAREGEAMVGRVIRQRSEVGLAPRGLHQHRTEILRGRHHNLHAAAPRKAQGDPALVITADFTHARHAAELAKHFFRRDIRHQY